MRGRCDNPKCGQQFGLQPIASHFSKKFCSKPCKAQYRHDLSQRKREERQRRHSVHLLFLRQQQQQ